MPTLAYPSIISTTLLGAQSYPAVASDQGQAVVVQAPDNMMACVKGFVLGAAGQYAYFTHSQTAFVTAPSSGAVPTYGQALSVPTGEKFEIWLAPKQTLWVLGSIANAVLISYQASYFDPQWPEDVPGAQNSGAGGYVGPKAHFVKR